MEIEKLEQCTNCLGEGWLTSGEPCPECLPPEGETSAGGTGYKDGKDRLHIKQVMRWLALEHNIQCSGKRLAGNRGAIEWCQLRAFHDGACEDLQGAPFSAM